MSCMSFWYYKILKYLSLIRSIFSALTSTVSFFFMNSGLSLIDNGRLLPIRVATLYNRVVNFVIWLGGYFSKTFLQPDLLKTAIKEQVI